MDDVLGEVAEVLVSEVRGQLEIVRGREGGIGVGQVLHGPTEAAPVYVPASVDRGAEPVEGHAQFFRLGLLMPEIYKAI